VVPAHLERRGAPGFPGVTLQTLLSGWDLFATQKFGFDVGMTIWRVVGGFVMAAVIAVPLGIAMGAYKPIEAFFEPFVSFARYLPASAFIPLLILWVGIGEAQKLTVIFIGCFFQLTLMVTMIVSGTRRDLVEAAYTLGCNRHRRRPPRPAAGAAPEIAEALRQVLGLGWTYIIVAELIGASSGIGHMITDSQALMATDHIIAGIVVIGLVGLASDLLFKQANRLLFAWSFLRCSRLSIQKSARPFPGVSRRPPPTEALRPVSLDVADNDFHHRAGPVGLRQVHFAAARGRSRGAPRPAQSCSTTCRSAVPGADRGVVFQSYTLFPWLTVRQNICFGLREKGVAHAEQRETSDRFIARMGLRGLRGSLSQAAFRRACSSGWRSRAPWPTTPRSCCSTSRSAALDNQTRLLMQELLLGVWEASRTTVLFVTHDIDEAIFMANRVVVFSARPGRIKCEVATELPHPRHYTIKTSARVRA